MKEKATFAGGCFWCVEATYQMVRGIDNVISGYAGGEAENPTYHKVSLGNTGHVESVQMTFDPNIISYKKLLDIFWTIHDPTTLNRQGADVGTQYKSVIFYHNEKQKSQALRSKQAVQIFFDDLIVTDILPLRKFWPAEDYHQNFYLKNPGLAYCQVIINPKLAKLRKSFRDLLVS